LREFTDFATQFILTAERAEKNVNLVAALAHQTNQPYETMLASAAEMSRVDSVEQRLALLDSIRSTVMTCAAAFETHTRYLREFTRPEGPEDLRGIVAKTKENTTIEALFDYQMRMFGALCRDKDIDLMKCVDEPCAGTRLRVNVPLFREALTNLIQNAVDALPLRLASGDKKKIELKATLEERGMQVDVSDNGCGIPDAQREAVFEPYFSKSGKGFGVGLTVVRRNLAAHGCDIELIPPHQGFSTTFRITIEKEAM
jgi:signal transduction histidine kinase